MINKRRLNQNRLYNLQRASTASAGSDSQSKILDDILRSVSSGKTLDSKLLSAGFLTLSEQNEIIKVRNILCLATSIGVFLFACFNDYSFTVSIISFFVCLYLLMLIYFIWLRFKINKIEREVYYDTPLFLEELVLLVESGLALFSALQRLCVDANSKNSKSLVRRYMSEAYRMASRGVQISEAFEYTARNCTFKPIKSVLLHLDVSASVGGELVFALQSLADQVHQEWKMSVETRVKKLENLVVFPVFAGVIGMMLLTAAVPLVPIIEFMDSIKKVGEASKVANESKIDILKN